MARDTGEVWLVAGPTASGKSALALRLAETIGAHVVNADSMQVYSDLRVLSARPSRDEETLAPHRLYGHVDGAETYSVGRWTREIAPVLAEPGPKVVVGGTGLYFRALTVGLADMPEIPLAIRAESERKFDDLGEREFRANLSAVDPAAAARISPGDRQRLVRAAAVHAGTGRALSEWAAGTRPLLATFRAVVLEPPRAALYARCDVRLLQMLEAGAVEEAGRLAARRLPDSRPVLKAVGVRELSALAAGRLSREAALEAAQRETRRYAKRQLTWFRNQTPHWSRLDGTDLESQWRQFLALAPHLTTVGGRETATQSKFEQ